MSYTPMPEKRDIIQVIERLRETIGYTRNNIYRSIDS